jgi:hypothetical protein
VDGERARELIRRIVGDGRDRAADAGVAEEDVEPLVGLSDVLCEVGVTDTAR